MRYAWLLLLVFPRLATAEPQPFDWQLQLEAKTYRYTKYTVRFPSPLPGAFERNNTVWGHLYLPRRRSSKKPPVVLVLPIMAAPNPWIEMRFVREYLRAGIAVMWMEMPFQFHRRPHPSMPSGQVFLARTAKRLGANFRQSVADAQRALTWLRRSGHVDPDRVGVFGISLGALVGSAVYSRDARPAAAVFMLGGADLPDLAFRSAMTRAFVEKAGITKEEARREWQGFDPVDYRDQNRGKRALLINGRSDTIIPPENGRRLAQAFPDAQQVWVPLGHYGAILHLLWSPSYAAARFVQWLN
jgi:dipeptidyl aminopeptidase/acylaminoacyl peptidase